MLEPSDPVPVDDAVATDLQCVLPPHVGGAAAAKPTPEIDNRFEEAGGKASPGPATKHAHTLIPPLRLTLKEKDTEPTRLRRGSQTKNPFWDKTIKKAKGNSYIDPLPMSFAHSNISAKSGPIFTKKEPSGNLPVGIPR